MKIPLQTQPFIISERHYKLILDQAKKNLPQESGGFLGGTDRTVKAVLPAFNQHIGNRTDTFGLTSEDIRRAHEFFEHHGLTYFGVYHSHPKGDPYPSQADINTGQHYHFIIGCRNPEKLILAAYEIIHNQPERVPIQLMSDKHVSVVDIRDKAAERRATKEGSDTKSSKPQSHVVTPVLGDLHQIMGVVDNITKSKPNVYPKLAPPIKGSDFSTLA
jgi:proteasome lid subunit RPN8/RPN11